MASDAEVDLIISTARAIPELERDLRRLLAEVEARQRPLRIEVETDRNSFRQVTQSIGQLGESLLRGAGSLASLSASAASTGLALGALLPVVAGVATAAAQIAPAAAVGVTGMLAMQLASGTLKLAMIGVEEAIKNAFDPEVTPDELAKSLERLAPEARKFVLELRSMQGALRRVQQSAQNRVFRDLDETLRTLGRTALPVVSRSIDRTADTLNQMARGAANAANQLSEQGTLGTALDGATKGLENLRRIPAQIVTGLGQIAAAAAPAFDKLTRRIDTAATSIAGRITTAFETGTLEQDIDQAISSIGQIFTSLGNILGGLRNIFTGLTTDGRGLFDILESITQAFEDLTASEEFQTILSELAKTADVLVKTILPLLQEAFVQLAPVIAELGPIVREFITAIGPDVQKVIEELGPVLLDIAVILREQLPFAIDLTISALQLLAIILRAAHFVLENLVLPIVREIKDFLNSEFVQSINNARDVIGQFSDEASGSFTSFGAVVAGIFRSSVRSVTDFGGLLRNDFVNSVVTSLGRAVREFQRVPGLIADAFAAIIDRMFSIGGDIIRGLIGGLQAQAGQLLGVAQDIADAVTGTIKGALGIASPSRVMIDVGKDTGEGFIIGLRSVIPSIEGAMSDLGRAAPSFALPDGNRLPLPAAISTAPTVQVFIGNEQLNSHVDVRVNSALMTQNRTLTQGVRT